MAVHLWVINVIQQLAAHIVKDIWGSFANKNEDFFIINLYPETNEHTPGETIFK